jgi:hypothetical protein
MKKITLLFAIVALSISSSAQVLNPGFETWVPNNETTTTYQMPQHWVTGDIFITLLNEIFGNPGYTVHSVTQTGASHSGNYAVQIGVDVSSYGDTVGGIIFYCDSATRMVSSIFGDGTTPGFPYSSRPANLTGWYKWNRIGNDTASVVVIMTKWNTTTQSRDTVVDVENFYITTAMSAWTNFSVPLPYLLNVYPDTIFMALGNASGIPHPGSVFTVDDLALTGSVPIGINEAGTTDAAVFIAPNPFTEQATLTIKNNFVSAATFEMYDVLGNKVRQLGDLSGSSFTIDREGLPAGIYFYTLTENNTVVATGKVSVE